MTYIDKQGLIDRGWERQLVQLTDKVNKPATTIDDTEVARHITDACSTIDSFLIKRYTLPLTSVPPVLVKVAADLAIYFLHGTNIGKDSQVAIAYRDDMTWLKGVAAGSVVIEDAGVIPAPVGGGQIKTKAPKRVFTRDSLGDM